MDTSELDGWIANLAPIYLQPEVIDGFVQRIDDAIAVANPEVAADRELRRDVDASTAAQLRVIVAAIAAVPRRSRRRRSRLRLHSPLPGAVWIFESCSRSTVPDASRCWASSTSR